jgi:hypothetical protein
MESFGACPNSAPARMPEAVNHCRSRYGRAEFRAGPDAHAGGAEAPGGICGDPIVGILVLKRVFAMHASQGKAERCPEALTKGLGLGIGPALQGCLSGAILAYVDGRW